MDSSSPVYYPLKDIRLFHYKSGLSIKWKIDNGRTDSIELTLLLSSYATKGSLYPTKIPASVMSHALNYTLPSNTTQISYAVACNSSEIFLVNLNGTGSYVKICHSQGNIVWIDFFKVSELNCLGFLERNGKLTIGIVYKKPLPNTEEKEIFKWQSLPLSIAPLCCLSVEDFLVLSDGHSSYLFSIKSNNEEAIKIEENERLLPYKGIVKIKEQNSKIIMSTCDGRTYSKSLFELKELAKNVVPSGSSSLHFQGLNLSQALLGIQKCSDVAKIESAAIENFNIYLEQIAIAQILISDPPKKLFQVDFEISSSIEKKGFFLLLIYIKLLSSSFKFRGRWWQLNVRLQECGNLNFLYSDMSSLNFTQTVKIVMHIPDQVVRRLVMDCNSNLIHVYFDLVLTNFTSEAPVCCVAVHKQPLDIIHFLTPHRNEDPFSIFESSFEQNVTELFKAFNNNQDKSTDARTRTFFLKKTFILLLNRHSQVLEKALPGFLPADATYSKQLWLQNVSLNVTVEKNKDDHFKVLLEGHFRPLVMAVKTSLEKRVFYNYPSSEINKKDKIKISSNVLKQANVSKLILDLETSNPASPLVIQRIYESVSNLISNIPL